MIIWRIYTEMRMMKRRRMRDGNYIKRRRKLKYKMLMMIDIIPITINDILRELMIDDY